MKSFSERRLVPQQTISPPLFRGVLRTRQTAEGKSIDIFTADSGARTSGNGTIIFGLPWSEYVARPDASDRYRIMAQETRTRVQAVDNVGFGDGTSSLTHAQAETIRAGDIHE